MRSVILLSGGLDSVVSLKVACERTEVLLALTFDYGQRAVRQEVAAARRCCELLGVPHQVVELNWLREITPTALINRRKGVPRLSLEDFGGDIKKLENAAWQVWVPNRNGAFINIAACFAETLGAELIVTGFNAEEGATFPDNSPEFVQAVNQSLQWSTLNRVQVISYTQELTKAEIVQLGTRIGAPLQYIYSCYLGGEQMCGQCEGCWRVKQAFRSVGYWRLLEDRFIDPSG